MDPAQLDAVTKRWAQEDMEKLLLLCDHYEIERGPTMFAELALSLAEEYVPAFREYKAHRPTKWTDLNKGALVVEIERRVTNDPTRGVKWAAAQVAKEEPWRSFLEVREGEETYPDPGEALRKVYYGFRGNKWAMVMRDAFKLHKVKGTLNEWDAQVVDYVRNPHPTD
jgi:hypothetical protein